MNCMLYPREQHYLKHESHRLEKRRPRSLQQGRGRWTLKKIVFLFTVLAFVSIFLAVGGFLVALSYYSKDLPNPKQLLERETVESSKIYDRTGEIVLYELHGDVKRTFITLSELPVYVTQATIAIEDQNFYQHRGVNILSLFKAVYEKMTRGGRLRGASTITQQLVKNAILSPERTLTRKIKEWMISIQLERKFSKDQILELYLNEIPYGSVVYGVEAASLTFFGKNAKDLSVPEAALLSALPKAPTYYSPYGTHTEELFARKDIILQLMAEQGYITEEEVDLYKKEEIQFSLKRESIQAPHFVMYVRDLLAKKYGEKFLEEGGLSIQTTLDMKYQKSAEEIIQQRGEENETKWNAKNAALVALDANTGQILTMVGSRDFFNAGNDGQVNVTLRPRQPGSSFKPIVYTAAFEKGYTEDTVLYDVITNFKDVCIGTPNYEPKNYTLQEHGPITMRKALAGSLNIPAVKTLYLVGVERVINLAGELGYESILKQRGNLCLSLVLGGGEVTLLEHVGGFSVLAQEGIKHEVAAILEIRDKDEQIIEVYQDTQKQVLDRDIARLTNNILSDNDARSFVFGQENKLHLKDRPVAAKTGTTNDYRDAWTIGFTPSLVTGVWVGNNDNSEMKRGADGSVVAAPIWNEFMQRALEGTEKEEFGVPPENTAQKPVLRGVIAQEVIAEIDIQSGKLATEYTPPKNRVKKIYHPLFNILHYVDKDNPRGDPPQDPTVDPQYTHWQTALQSWAEKQGLTIDTPPTEYDDVHTANNKPTAQILSPQANDTITDRHLVVDIDAFAPRNIRSAEYFIDDMLLLTVKTPPFDLQYDLGDEVSNGFHTLKIFVYDDLNNFASQELNINFLLPPLPPDFRWKNISSAVILEVPNFPYIFTGEIINVNSVKKIAVQYRSLTNSVEQTILSQNNPKESRLSFEWKTAPSPGNYEMFALLLDNNGKEYKSRTIAVTVKEKTEGDENEESSSIFDALRNRRGL